MTNIETIFRFRDVNFVFCPRRAALCDVPKGHRAFDPDENKLRKFCLMKRKMKFVVVAFRFHTFLSSNGDFNRSREIMALIAIYL